MAQITEAKLFEWLGRLYAERQSIAEERDEARRVAVQLTQQLQEAQVKKGTKKSQTT
jgi:hypothetical protein